MSCRLSGSSECSLDADDLVEMRERFNELTKEKDILTGSKSDSFELIRKLELHEKRLSKSRDEDKKRIAELERELCNSRDEIDFLQDRLRKKTSDLNYLTEQLCSLQLKLEVMENSLDELGRLREKVNVFESERSLLIQELENKKVTISTSISHMEKLEESISSAALEYQCEIEIAKLESTALEQNLFETKQQLEERTLEILKMNKLIRDLELRIQDRDEFAENITKENGDLKRKLYSSDMNAKAFVMKFEEQFHEWLQKSDDSSASKLERNTRAYGNVLGTLFSKLATPEALDADAQKKITEMSHQMEDYELLVEQLKEKLKDERLKAKESAEDLIQEMAELRYRLTSLLDEECKRRATIERISLQRIAELEAQIARERQKPVGLQDLVVNNL